jgi:hypothetical protein
MGAAAMTTKAPYGTRIVFLLAACLFYGSLVAQERLMSEIQEEEELETNEYQLKASLLWQFVKFVDWADRAMPKDSKSIVIGVLGSDPFGKHLDALKGKEAKGRKLDVRRYERVEDVKEGECHVLFVSSGYGRKVEDVASALAVRSILVVGEKKASIDAGLTVGFTVKDRKIAFEINLDAAKRSGLAVSTKLVKLASRVIKPKDK